MRPLPRDRWKRTAIAAYHAQLAVPFWARSKRRHEADMAFQRTGSALAAATLTGSAWLATDAGAQSTSAEPTEEIVVTSSIVPTPRRQLATAVSVIDGASIELRGYDGLADTLRTQPGIGVTNSGGAGKTTTLRIRGEDGFRTLLM